MTNPITKFTTIEVSQDDYGTWHATQEGVTLTGRGPNAARAVAHYDELVAETTYEIDDSPTAEVPGDD